MKKLLALLLVLVMSVTVIACGKKDVAEENEPALNIETQIEEPTDEEKTEEETKPEKQEPEKQEPEKEEKPAEKTSEPSAPLTVGNKLLAEFKQKASSGSALAIAESIATGGSLPFMAGAMEVEPGLLSGFDNAEITGFKSGAVFQPMIGSIAFIGYVFELEDGVSASDFIANLKKNANLRWNICVEAEEMVTGRSQNKVFFVMSPKHFEE